MKFPISIKSFLLSLIVTLSIVSYAHAAIPGNCQQIANGENCGAGNYIVKDGCSSAAQINTWNTGCGASKEVYCPNTPMAGPASCRFTGSCDEGYSYNASTNSCTNCAPGYTGYDHDDNPATSDQCVPKSTVIYDTALDLFKATGDGLWKMIGMWHSSGSDIYYDTGNVGIGTTSPSALLHIQNVDDNVATPLSEGPFIHLTRNDSYTSISEMLGGIAFDSTDGGVEGSLKKASAAIIGTSGETYDANNKGGYLYFYTKSHGAGWNADADVRMVINSDGEVGIGTTSLYKTLTVGGTGIQVGTLYGGDADLDVRGKILAKDYIYRSGDTNSDTKIGFPAENTISLITAGSNRIYVNSSGNVGMGTTSPTSKLEIYGDAQNIEISNTSETNAGIIFNDAQATTSQKFDLVFNSSDNDLHFSSDTVTDVLRLSDGGNVGIGINPSYKLEVAGRVKINSSDAGIWYEAGTNDWFVGRDGGGDFRWYQGDDEMRLTTSGNLQIDGDLTVSGGEIDIAWGPSAWTTVTNGSAGYVHTYDTAVSFSNRYCFVRKSDQAFCEVYRSGTTCRLKQITAFGHPNGGCEMECLGIR